MTGGLRHTHAPRLSATPRSEESFVDFLPMPSLVPTHPPSALAGPRAASSPSAAPSAPASISSFPYSYSPASPAPGNAFWRGLPLNVSADGSVACGPPGRATFRGTASSYAAKSFSSTRPDRPSTSPKRSSYSISEKSLRLSIPPQLMAERDSRPSFWAPGRATSIPCQTRSLRIPGTPA